MISSRREILKLGALGTAALFLPRFPVLARATEPRFFLHVLFPGGMDWSYLFDARPLEMTKNGWIQNYAATEPVEWLGQNGQRTWVTPLVAPLRPFQAHFSVLNGILMAPNFDGHLQNLNYMLAGNAFGGDSYWGALNQVQPLDCVHTGGFGVDVPQLTRLDGTIPLDVKSAKALGQVVSSVAPLDLNQSVMKYWSQRLKSQADLSDGAFSKGTGAMWSALQRAPELMRLLRSVDLSTASGDDELAFLPVMGEFFRKQIATGGLVVFSKLDTKIDVHASTAAQAQPKLYSDLVEKIARVFTFLKRTPFDGTRSLLDVTTVLVSSEFMRTMRQPNRPIDQTGTDHNNLCNSILIGGRGIRGGSVFGRSDFQSSNETLSKAHLQVDPHKLKVMACPFDFASQAPSTNKPEIFRAADYLSFPSVVNTIFEAFDVPKESHWAQGSGQPRAPALRALLAGT